MNQNTKHFVLTHFNLKLSRDGERCYTTDKNNQHTQNDSWMDERIRLFETYCLPSIKAQTNSNFTWLVFLDKDTADTYKKKFDNYHSEFPNCVPVYIGPASWESLYLKVDPILREYLDSDDQYIITTNIDNDDSFHEDMVDKIQNAFIEHKKEALYRFVYGYQFFEDMRFAMKMRYPHNHFLTLVTKITNEPIKPITNYGHAGAHRVLPYIDIKTTPTWIEVVHGTNVNNSLRVKFKIRYVPVIFKNSFRQKFNVNIKLNVGNNLYRSFITIPCMIIKHLLKKISK